jgi:hypothetical protein
MPEAAVNKNGKPLGSKDKIRLPWQIEVPSPAGDSCLSEDGKENVFSSSVVLRANTRHIARALFPSQPVSHCSLYFFSGLTFSNFALNQRRTCN